jgi:hypothetical protein
MSSRDVYVAKGEADFAEVQAQLSALAAAAQDAVAAGHAEGERVLQGAKSKHDEALHRLELLKRAGEDSWSSVKTTFEAAWTELRHALGPQK